MAKINKNMSLETAFRSVFQSSGIQVTSSELKSVMNSVSQRMGLKALWPGHPKMGQFLDIVYQEIKLKHTNG